MRITINDRQNYDITRREYTDEGFIRVPGRVARTGIQDYLASELGITDRAPNDIVRIFRPEEEVFNDQSLESYLGADVTDDHPPAMVDASSYKEYTVGTVRSVGIRDGDFVSAELIIKDRNAISNVESGKVQLSAGYTAEYDMTPGVTPDGQSYDGVQRSIKINHVAIVSRARAGAMARIFDKQEGKPMFVITLDSGSTVEVADKSASTLITDSIKRLTQATIDKQAEVDTHQVVIDSLTEEVNTLKTKTSDAALEARIKAVADARIDAVKVAGKEFSCDSVDVVEIQRAAMTVAKPKMSWSDKDAAYVAGAFDMEVADVTSREEKPDDEEDETNDVGGRSITQRRRGAGDSYNQLAQDGARDQQTNDQNVKVSSYDSYKAGLGKAWDKGSK